VTEARRWQVLVGSLLGLTLLLAAVGTTFMFRSLDRPFNAFGFRGANLMLTLAVTLVGASLASRRHGNPIGWIFLGAGVAGGVQFLAQEYAVFAQTRGDQLGAAIGTWIDSWIWVPIVGSVTIHVCLLFPTGHPPSPRWRPVLWTGTAGIVLFAAAFALGSETELGLENPLFEVSDTVTGPALGVGAILFLGSLIAAVGSLVHRFRRSWGDERQQLKWFVAAASLVAFFLAMTFFAEFVTRGWDVVGRVAEIGTIATFMLIPVATGVAVLKYHLYDIDVVINRAVVYGVLAAFVTLVYVGIAVGIGALVGSRGNLLLSIVATALIALAFQPMRERARGFANRLVYGKRATPYEVMSEFAERMAGTYALDDVLPRMARIAAEGTGADRVEVWVRVGNELRLEASWPGEGGSRMLQLAPDAGLPSIPDVDRAIPVTQQEEVLGALAVAMPRTEALTPAGEKLLGDLASQAGLVLRNVRLIEELRASRQRLVAAQDEERRRLERNIHDGAQQQLVALSVKERLVQAMIDRDPEKAKRLVAELQNDTLAALDDMRDLARGIYPPLLADQGLAAALESQARKSTVPVRVEPNGVGRYPQEAEAAAYFCVLEALQNIAKYAQASRVTVRLRSEEGHLVFAVEDDGQGFDVQQTPSGSGLQNMKDRLEALGGRVDVRSEPGAGTTVTGRIPVATES
jgi:signal transduction histidine kinase